MCDFHGERFDYRHDDGAEYCSRCELVIRDARIAALEGLVKCLENRWEDYWIAIGRHLDGMVAARIRFTAPMGQKAE